MDTSLETFFASTYALYLKTQSYHWHVRGPNFASLHVMFEEQYTQLAAAVDALAERILMRDSDALVPSDFKTIDGLSGISVADPNLDAQGMLEDLMTDHRLMAAQAAKLMRIADEDGDLATVSLMDERLSAHEKDRWFLASSC